MSATPYIQGDTNFAYDGATNLSAVEASSSRCHRPRVWLYRRRRRHRAHCANAVAQSLLVHHPPDLSRVVTSTILKASDALDSLHPYTCAFLVADPTFTAVSCQTVSKRHDTTRHDSTRLAYKATSDPDILTFDESTADVDRIDSNGSSLRTRRSRR
jgi:hypothetical protein